MCRALSRRRPRRTSDSVDSGSPASAATVARVLPLHSTRFGNQALREDLPMTLAKSRTWA